jgi:hypothetical protein
MLRIGKRAGRRVAAVLSDMDRPLGKAVGNALEVAEAIEVLRGGGAQDLRALCVLLGGAMLSLSTAQAERRLSDTSAAAARAYYAADLEAEEIFARLRAGEQVDAVTRTGSTYSYSCSISENQTLNVELKKTDEAWQVLHWQVEVNPPQMEQVLPVWNGT